MMPKPTRTRRSAKQWERLLDQQRRSGQSQADFCAAQGLSLASFSYWRRKLCPRPQSVPASEAPEWLELPGVSSGMFPPASTTRPGWDLELDLGQGL